MLRRGHLLLPVTLTAVCVGCTPDAPQPQLTGVSPSWGYRGADTDIVVDGRRFFPLVEAMGFDLIWFGIVTIIAVEIGLLTPPVGLNLIVAMSAFREKFGLLVRAAVPFILLMILALGLISFIPEISLFFVR